MERKEPWRVNELIQEKFQKISKLIRRRFLKSRTPDELIEQQSSPVDRLFQLLNPTDQPPNLSQIGNMLLEISERIIGKTKEIERIRMHWEQLPEDKRQNPDDLMDNNGELWVFATAVKKIAQLSKERNDNGDSRYIFYVPEGSGIVRLTIGFDGRKNPVLKLVSGDELEPFAKNFKNLLSESRTFGSSPK